MTTENLKPYVLGGYWTPGYSEYDAERVITQTATKSFYDKRLDGTEVIYVDFDMGLNTHPVTGDFIMKINEKAIVQSLKNCVMSAPGDFPMEGDIGGGLDRMLFDQNDAMIAFNARRKIEETVLNHENRIELEEVGVRRNNDKNGLDIDIKFMFANRPELIVETIRVDRRR